MKRDIDVFHVLPNEFREVYPGPSRPERAAAQTMDENDDGPIPGSEMPEAGEALGVMSREARQIWYGGESFHAALFATG
jgi:hypothetical protein